jgi:uncharacterized protein (DUF427 family)
VTARLRVVVADVTVADTTAGRRVLETSQAPAYYFPPGDVDRSRLAPAAGRSFCEWKGVASYYDVVVGDDIRPSAAWTYPDPTGPFRSIAGWLAFYARRVDACWVGDEEVEPNGGDFYGGWITSTVTGPFKGAPGTADW